MPSSRASRAVKGAVRRLGYDLVRRHYYSPIPNVDKLPADTWTRASELRGVDFDPIRSLEFVESELAPFLAEYGPPRQATGNPRDFHLDNGFYEDVDAETLYAMVRRFEPRRIVELGSGMSTLVIADARARNGTGGEGGHVVYDPFPRSDLVDALQRVADLRAVSATEIPLEDFDRLGPGDLLFVDTTHTVKVGGDVNRVILDVVPSLAPGVYVHIHDIYLPWEYPREFLAERNFYWAEQFLLQAFLSFNHEFEILFGAHALVRRYPDRIRTLIPASGRGIPPSAFWLRRVGG